MPKKRNNAFQNAFVCLSKGIIKRKKAKLRLSKGVIMPKKRNNAF